MNELTNPKNFTVKYHLTPRPNNPLFETDDLAERVRKFLADSYIREPYATFYLRNFLISKQIMFPPIRIHEDEPFAFKGMCLAEKLLLVPNIFYIVRPRQGSVTRESGEIDVRMHRNLRLSIDGFNALKRIMDNIKFFGEHPDYRYAVLDWYIQSKLNFYFLGIYAQVHPAVLNPFVEKEFHSDDAAFAAYLFNTVNIYRLQIMQLQAELKKLRGQ